MPISFSAWCIISLVMRGAGVGEGTGVGEGVWASASSGNFVAAILAAPRAGSSFTKARRVVLFFFIVVLAADFADERRSFIHRFSVLQLYNFRFAETIDRDNVEVVVFAFGNDRVSLAAQLRHHRGDRVVVTGDEDRLAAISGLDSLQ